ncbi:MAG: phytanoyl-CoA dioxygenase [Solirubrobacterales bacterium]|nr:phytanoyl-CoA dioxygenase [Solirubrobacterales bacterium]
MASVHDHQEQFAIARGAMPLARVDDALRLLHLDLLSRGADAQELGSWLWGAHWFPHLNEHAAITALADALPEKWRTGTRCDPQILLQFPHTGPDPEITFHVDQEPDWAGDRRYLRIVGVPLSPWRVENGGLLVKPGADVVPVEADPGDVVMMQPDLLHSGGVNRTGAVRYAVYFRFLGESG